MPGEITFVLSSSDRMTIVDALKEKINLYKGAKIKALADHKGVPTDWFLGSMDQLIAKNEELVFRLREDQAPV